MASVAVTGATGFVGRHIIARASDLGIPVTGVSRSSGGPDLIHAANADWAEAFRGADVAIHLAAILPWTEAPGCEEALRAANVTGAERALRGLAAAGGKHFIFLSTIGVNGVSTAPGVMFRSDDAPDPSSAYAATKQEAEERLRVVADELGLGLTIVRPPLVYGPTQEGSFASLVRLVCRLPVLPLGGLSNHRDLVGVRNLADCLLALASERPVGTFLVSDEHPLSTTALVRLIGSAAGRSPRLLPVPGFVRRGLVALPPTRGIAVRLYGNIALDTSDLQKACSWRPRFLPEEEIARIGE